MNMQARIGRVGLAIAARPWPVIMTFAAALALSLIAASGLGLDTAIEDMLPPGNPHAQAFIELTEKFTTTSNLIVAVEGPDRASMIAAAEEFARLLVADPNLVGLVRNIRLGLDGDFVKRWGFMLAETDELEDREAMFAKTNLVPFVRAVNDSIESSLSDGSASVRDGDEEDALVSLMTGFELFATDLRDLIEATEENGGVSGPASHPLMSALVDDALVGERYMIDPEGRTLLFAVTPSFDLGERDKLSALAEEARRVGAKVSSKAPGVVIGFAGDVAVEADEEKSLGADSFYPSLLAMAVIFVLFVLSMKSLRAILLSLAALAAGILLDLGFAALAVGELNMITSSFGVLLVGLGIDFCIHLATRFDEARDRGLETAAALAESLARIFAPVCVGGLTTATAFYSLLLSGSSAFRQFGLIAGTGIVFCLLTTFALLPALLAAFPGKSGGARKHRRTLTFVTLSKLGLAAGAARYAVLAAAAALVVAAVVSAGGNRFEYDFRAIGPRKTASHATEKLIGERFHISTYTTLAYTDTLEEARDLGRRASNAPFARRAESLADFLAEDGEQDRRLEVIARMRDAERRAADTAWTAGTVDDFARELQRLEWNLIELADLAAASFGEESMALRKRDLMIREIRGGETGAPGRELFMSLAGTVKRAASSPGGLAGLASVDAAFARAMSDRIDAMAAVTRRMTEADLPEYLLRDFRSAEGDAYLVSVHPSWGLDNDDEIQEFTAGLAAIDPGFTGSLQLGYEFSRVTLEEARKAAFLVVALVFAFTLIGFRSLKYAVASFLSLAFAIVLLFGIYPFLAKFNIVSILALPLVFGMGIDYSVHAATSHQGIRDLSGRERLAAALADTRKPIALSALTTLIGFGSLALVASFRGIMDLGLILSLGIALCWLSTYLVLPALLMLGGKAKKTVYGPDGLEEVS
ncbi:MAG: MMPL family transporter [Spirochaetaceae bacterium]|nr:MMPL family transporter [Spirochaetaceae bacterium]